MRLRRLSAALALTTLAACGTTVPVASQGPARGQITTSSDQLGQADPAAADAATAGLPGSIGSSVGNTSAAAGPGAAAGLPREPGSTAGPGPGSATVKPGPSVTANKPGSAATRVGSKPAAPGRPAATAVAHTDKPAATSSGGTVGGVANGPGVTPTTIEIGYIYAQNAAAAQAAFGASVNYGDPLASTNATVAYINAHGGVAGRKIHLDTYAYDATSTDSSASLEQAACSHFTDDVKVFAVANAPQDGLRICLDKHGVGALGTSLDALGSGDFAADPSYLDLMDNPPQSSMTNLVDALAKNGYLSTRWDTTNQTTNAALPVKIGIILPDDARWNDAVSNYLLPALKKQGIVVAPGDVYKYTEPQSSADDAAAVSQIQSAALQFRSDNVTHVIPTDANAAIFFSTGANSQKYYPRLALTSGTEAQIGVTSNLVPAQSLIGAVGIGWHPLIDVNDFSHYRSAGLALCEKLNTDAGLQLSGNIAEATAANICDMFFMIQSAAARIPAGQPLTLGTFVTAAQTLGSSFPISVFPTSTFTSGKRYPTNQAWAWGWDTGCSCMKYSGDPFPLR